MQDASVAHPSALRPMAVLGKWTGGSITANNLPETFAAPNGLFPTEARNDGSAYSFAAATSTLTLPGSDLADGYLLVAGYEYFDNGARFNPQGHIIQASGTGDFVGAPSGGYLRDASEDRAFVTCWAFVNNPSVSSTYQFQWKADADDADAGDTTENSFFLVIPLFYADVGIYASTNSDLLGGTTRNTLPLTSTVLEGTNITRSSNTITVTGDNKRYLILSAQFFEGRGGRTQRIFGLTYDGSPDLATQSYAYYRNGNNDESGHVSTDILETNAANRTIVMTCYRGDGVGAFQGGGNIDGSNPGVGDHGLVVLELNDSAEVFRTKDGTGSQELALTGPVDLTVCRVGDIDFNDDASWVRASDIAMNAEVAMDALVSANVWAAQGTVGSGSRWTARTHITVNGTEDVTTRNGNYQRNNQGTSDTFGWAASPMGFVALSVNDDVGVSVQEHAGTEGGAGNVETQAGTVGFWGINLDTLEAVAAADDTEWIFNPPTIAFLDSVVSE